jgi:hypothetical protein
MMCAHHLEIVYSPLALYKYPYWIMSETQEDLMTFSCQVHSSILIYK